MFETLTTWTLTSLEDDIEPLFEEDAPEFMDEPLDELPYPFEELPYDPEEELIPDESPYCANAPPANKIDETKVAVRCIAKWLSERLLLEGD